MAKEVSQDALNLVDEVFKEEDPAFLADLEKIKPEDLNNQPLDAMDPEEVKRLKELGLRGKWMMLRPQQKKIIYASVFIVFVGIPLVILSALGLLTPQFSFDEIPSMAYLADEATPFETSEDLVGVLSLENDEEFNLRTREMLIQLKTTKNAKGFVRVIFEIGMASEEDRVYVSKREKDIIDIVTEVLTNTTHAEFAGIEGKEMIRRKIIVALNKKLEGKVKSLHYDQFLFQ